MSECSYLAIISEARFVFPVIVWDRRHLILISLIFYSCTCSAGTTHRLWVFLPRSWIASLRSETGRKCLVAPAYVWLEVCYLRISSKACKNWSLLFGSFSKLGLWSIRVCWRSSCTSDLCFMSPCWLKKSTPCWPTRESSARSVCLGVTSTGRSATQSSRSFPSASSLLLVTLILEYRHVAKSRRYKNSTSHSGSEKQRQSRLMVKRDGSYISSRWTACESLRGRLPGPTL